VADWVETLMTAYLGEVGRDVVFTTGFDRPLYPPFANGGHGVIPNVISQIDTVEGEVLYRSSQSDPGRLLTDQQVGMMNDIFGSSVEGNEQPGPVLPGVHREDALMSLSYF